MATDGFDSGGADGAGDPIVIPTITSWPWWSGEAIWLPWMRRTMEEKGRARTQYLISTLPRPVTQIEANALADLIGEDMARHAFFRFAIGFGGIAWAMRSGLRLPFIKLNPEKYHEKAFPSIARPWVVGPGAKFMWFTTRAAAYAFVLMVPGSFVQAMSGMALARRFMNEDPRLTNLKLTIMNKVADADLSRDVAGLSKAAHRMTSEQIREQLGAFQEEYERLKQRIEDGEGQFASLRPEERTRVVETLNKRVEAAQQVARTVLEARENPALVEKQRKDYQALSDTDTSVPAPSTTNTLGLPRKSPSISRPAPEETGQGWGDATAFTDDVDDASPVAYSARQGDGAGTGSAWDRVRRQAELERSPANKNNDSDDSWGSTSEQKADSKSKRNAQQEFDELVDRERRG